MRAAGGWMPSASASRSRAAVCAGDWPASARTASTCRPRNSAVRVSKSATRSTRRALMSNPAPARGPCAHTRKKPGRNGLTSAYEPVRASSMRTTSSRLAREIAASAAASCRQVVCTGGVPCLTGASAWSAACGGSPWTAPGYAATSTPGAYRSASRCAVESGAEYAPVHVFSVAGRQRLSLKNPGRTVPVRSPLSPDEEGTVHRLGVEPVRKVEEVGNEEHPDVAGQQRADDLAGDLGAFPFVGRSERLVAQHHAAWGYLADNVTHPAELLVQLPALHGRVFLALVVREDAVADSGAE